MPRFQGFGYLKMTETLIDYREILWTECTLDGKNTHKENMPECPPHMFIILTRRGYNLISDSVLGIPISSLKGDQKIDSFRLNYGVNICQDDIEGGGNILKKESVILCDRPCRIAKTDIRPKYDEIKITKEKMREITGCINVFIATGNIKNSPASESFLS